MEVKYSLIVALRLAQARNCFSDILIALNVSDVLHIVLAMLENLRNCLEDSYPNVLIHIFPHFHYPFYRSTSTTTIIGDVFFFSGSLSAVRYSW